MFTISLIQPQIPPNTGNIARLCAALQCRLDLVGKLGFSLDDKYMRRAGLDYWKYVMWQYHENLENYMESLPVDSIHLFTVHTKQVYWEREFKENDFLLFGSEIDGIPAKYREKFADSCCTLPMSQDGVRCINLSSAVSAGAFEAMRQIQVK